MKKRVVITGIGMVSPLGNNVQNSWNNIINEKSGISSITRFDTSELTCKVAGEIKYGTKENELDIDKFISFKERKKMDRFIHFAIIAAEEAIKNSGWVAKEEKDKLRTGVVIGSGIGGLPAIQDTTINMIEKGCKRISPFFITSSLINLSSGHISIKYDFRGPNFSTVSACASSNHAIGESFRTIQYGDADVMICGGAESAICKIGIGGFAAIRALSTNFNNTPELASRPWDMKRDGFVMGEGSGILVLEEYEHAKKRDAIIYGEIIGYGMSSDAHHITAPEKEGTGAFNAMKLALNESKLNYTSVNYINAHGTSTPSGDLIEIKAIKNLFKNHAQELTISSTKSSTGHLLGAAGSIEAIFSLLAIKNNVIPPTLNLENPDSECCDLDLTPNNTKEKIVNIAMSNSFGFGGTNACLMFRGL